MEEALSGAGSPTAPIVTISDTGMLWPYLKTEEVFFCPNDPVVPNTIYGLNGRLAGANDIGGQYTPPYPQPGTPLYNDWPVRQTYYTLGQIRYPGHTLVFAEMWPVVWDKTRGGWTHSDRVRDPFARNQASFRPPIWIRPNHLYIWGTGTTPLAPYHAPLRKGRNGMPISFVDGHVLFWVYSTYDPTIPSDPHQLGEGDKTEDFSQLAAWSGGEIPPGHSP